MSTTISGSYGNQNLYSGFTYFKRETENSKPEELTDEKTSYLEVIQDYKEQIVTKIRNGDTETKFQIGSEALTEKEWDQLLERFDSQEDAIKELVEEEIEERKQEEQKEALLDIGKTETLSEVQVDMLTSETVQARFPLQETDEDGNQKEELYLVAIDVNGIRCSRAGSDTYEWEIEFTDESQYEKVTAFMDVAKDYMDNFLFSAHQNFWEDFLGGNLDVDAFQGFLEGTNNGIPDYSITVGDSMYIDESKAQWTKYMNPLGAKFYTAEEMWQMQMDTIQRNAAKLRRL